MGNLVHPAHLNPFVKLTVTLTCMCALSTLYLKALGTVTVTWYSRAVRAYDWEM